MAFLFYLPNVGGADAMIFQADQQINRSVTVAKFLEFLDKSGTYAVISHPAQFVHTPAAFNLRTGSDSSVMGGATFTDEECEKLLRGYLSTALWDAGMICRADDRGDPVIQLSPPLIAQPEDFEEVEGMLRPVLEEASRRWPHSSNVRQR